MLFVFNLDWKRFSISDVVVEANNYLEKLCKELDAAEKVIFNCASLGAGEWVLGNKKDKETGLTKGNGLSPDTLNYLRWHHHQVNRVIRNSVPFVANRDMTEMLKALKTQGHELAVVGTTRTENIEDDLIATRTRHYFDGNVYGYDKVLPRLRGNFTLAALFATAIDEGDSNYEEALVVADTPTAIQDASPLGTRAVVGYLDPYVDWDEQTIRLKEMDDAGANYTAVGGHTVSVLPIFLACRASQAAEIDIQSWMKVNVDLGKLIGRSPK